MIWGEVWIRGGNLGFGGSCVCPPNTVQRWGRGEGEDPKGSWGKLSAPSAGMRRAGEWLPCRTVNPLREMVA